MALLREEAEKKSRQDAERKAKEREAAMLDLKVRFNPILIRFNPISIRHIPTYL